MENQEPRYRFSGFTFGTQNYFNLIINIKNFSGVGTSMVAEFALELTEAERLDLIKLLINVEKEED